MKWITKVIPSSWDLMVPPLPHSRVKTTLVVHRIRSQNVVLRTRLLRYALRLT